jgi:hypothetical protein
VVARPFQQSDQYDLARIRFGPEELEGPAYRFLLLLPARNEGGVIFSRAEQALLLDLLTSDLGGVTTAPDTVLPPRSGIWRSGIGQTHADRHSLFEVYTKQDNLALAYFEELAWRLEGYSRAAIAQRRPDGYRGEDQILIEMTPVVIVRGRQPPLELR